MSKILDLKNLGLRVYNDKMIIEDVNGEKINKDEKDILDICNKTFGNGGTPSPDNLHLFNELLVQTATEIAKPKLTQILSLLADVDNAPAGATKIYKVSKTQEAKFAYSAKGTGVELVRLGAEETKKIAVPQALTFGTYYEASDFRGDPMKAFKDAVNSIAQAQINYYFEKIQELVVAAVTNGEIPENNRNTVSNAALSDFKKVEETMIRLTGGRPVMVADIALINKLTDQIPTAQANLLTDDVRDMLREDLVPSKISKTIALPLDNTWIDENNSKVRFDVQTGYVIPGGAQGKKPFAITNFGSKRQYSEFDIVTEEVKLKVVLDCDITLLNARYLGIFKDSSVIV